MLESIRAKIVLFYGSTIGLVEAGEFYALDVKEAFSDKISIQFQKDSEYTEIFSHQLRKMDENGINHRLALKWMPKIDESSSVEPALSLGYDNVLLPFLALLAGGMLSVLVALFETTAMFIYKLRVEIQEF